MSTTSKDLCRQKLTVGGKSYTYYSLAKLAETYPSIAKLPHSLKILLENLLRNEDGTSVTEADIQALAEWADKGADAKEIAFRPARVLMQDFTGVPAVVDLAAMRDAMVAIGGDPEKINPLSPVDLVIDHSVMVDYFGGADSAQKNTELEFSRNQERYQFLRWGSKAFSNFRVVPPGTGICHQVNLEYLAQTVWTREDGNGSETAYPDSVVGTDSHTTMVNGLAVLGWGVGGIEAESSMLGQPISMLIPDVIGYHLEGSLPEGATATDLVLVIVEALRKKGVVGKFVEFYGPGVDQLSLADRATIANMAPEYGATCGFFPVDDETLRYLKLTSRDADRIALVEAYAKAQGMWRTADDALIFTDELQLDLNDVVPSMAGPKRPQDRVILPDVAASFANTLKEATGRDTPKSQAVVGADYDLSDGDVVIAAITSCTNTSNPSVLVAAGLLAKAAHERGLTVPPWVKTSLAPGSKVVTDYLDAAGLSEHLDALGFYTVGYGCTTCIGNSGPLAAPLAEAVDTGALIVTSVLSGNRNFEGRINPLTAANYLASPPLVVAYALAGSVTKVMNGDPLGMDTDGKPVYLRDLWPSNKEVRAVLDAVVDQSMFAARYGDVFTGTKDWQEIGGAGGLTYDWDDGSSYVQNPPYFEGMTLEVPEAAGNIMGARILALLGDSITTDHISPAGSIHRDGPAGDYLSERQIRPTEFNSYGARRGNHQIMMRGTFANGRLKNEAAPETTGGYARHIPSGDVAPIYDVAMRYAGEDTPLVIIGGKEYGTGSSRDWAAKGTRLLGIKAVIAESFERIHRSNLIGMGVLPLQFANGDTRKSLNLTGAEGFDITGIEEGVSPQMMVEATIHYEDGKSKSIKLLARVDTASEADYFRNGGILQYVLRQLAAS